MPTTSRPLPPWLAVKTLFERLVELPAPQRAQALAQAAANPAVAAEVRELLAQHAAEEGHDSGFLTTPAVLQALPEVDRCGERLGPWAITTRLGEGGMGEVWEARRGDGAYEARVAIKVLRGGFDAQALLARFEQEQRTLARFDHPNIARLLDAGRTADGAPYFVMEAVPGRPIDEACRGLPLPARLRLFLQLADAVAYAHRNLLVHRDLKPANVLVTDEGQVKLLDFGIAHALDGAADDSSGHSSLDAAGTGAPLRALTPGSASPEQVRGEPVGTATDVYSLGVLLHVLVTGTRPYGRQASTAAQALDAVLHEAPVPPSAAPLPEDGARSVPRAQLRGDLDAIVARALAKPIEARYASVDALAADLRAHLHRLPVLARPQTLLYRASGFARRNRAATTIATASLCALLALLGRLAWQVQETETARRETVARFAEVRQLAHRLVFSYHDRIVNLAGALLAREALLSDALSYLDGMARSAPRDPALARELAQTYQRVAVLYGETFSASLERVADAEASLDKALALLPLYVNAPDVDVGALGSAVDMWLMRAQLHARQGRLRASAQALEQARPLAQRAATRAPGDLQVQSLVATLAGRQAQALGGNPSLANLGRVDEAGQQWRVALALFEGMVAQEPHSAEWQHQLGWALSGITAWAVLAGRNDEATRHGARLVAVRDAAAALLPDDAHLRYQAAMARINNGVALSAAGRHAEAARSLGQGQALIAEVARADPANRSAARDLPLAGIARGRQLVGAGQLAQAQAVLEQVLRDLPAAEQMAGDFYMLRWRAEAGVWLARSLASTEPQAALQRAREAELVLATGAAHPGAGPGTDTDVDSDNAARRWARAQALGEQAQALLRLRQPEQARIAAQQALVAWGDSIPGGMAAWAARDRSLAQAPARALVQLAPFAR